MAKFIHWKDKAKQGIKTPTISPTIKPIAGSVKKVKSSRERATGAGRKPLPFKTCVMRVPIPLKGEIEKYILNWYNRTYPAA